MIADKFLATAHLYQLGFLDTEKPHPETTELSSWSTSNLPLAVEKLLQIDSSVLDKLIGWSPAITNLRAAVKQTWQNEGRVFLCGCGATGRLSLLIECLYREINPGSDKVVAFMAGGDVALVHSVEGFEDFPEYGARHLRQMGFQDGDLLIASTEGGETPYVIGATVEASNISKVKPYFLFCNRSELLADNIKRSKEIIENPQIHKIELFVGPMALAGSTRMQASTVLQLAVGFGLLIDFDAEAINRLKNYLNAVNVDQLAEFVISEAETYKNKEYVMYRPSAFEISVFTDTTERAPTFSLTPFSHDKAIHLLSREPSFSYVSIANAKDGMEAWQKLLRRNPKPLEWEDVDPRTGSEYLLAFDFGPRADDFRKRLTAKATHHNFEISEEISEGLNDTDRTDKIVWRFRGKTLHFAIAKNEHPLIKHTFVKMLLNIHSTLIMGRLGRYEGNLMTWVYPNNGKLIDRAARYVGILLERRGIQVEYEQIVRRLLELHPNLPSNTSVVLQTMESFLR